MADRIISADVCTSRDIAALYGYDDAEVFFARIFDAGAWNDIIEEIDHGILTDDTVEYLDRLQQRGQL